MLWLTSDALYKTLENMSFYVLVKIVSVAWAAEMNLSDNRILKDTAYPPLFFQFSLKTDQTDICEKAQHWPGIIVNVQKNTE